MEKTSRVELPSFPRQSKINRRLRWLRRTLSHLAKTLRRKTRHPPKPLRHTRKGLAHPNASPTHPLLHRIAHHTARLPKSTLRQLAHPRIALPLRQLFSLLAKSTQLWQARLRDLAFPIDCGRCGKPISEQERWCRDCRQMLGIAAHPPDLKPQCPRCAAIRPPQARSSQGCSACSNLDLPFDSVTAVGSYHGGLRRSVIDVKRTLDPPLIAALAETLAESLRFARIDQQIDLIVPVPPRQLGPVQPLFKPQSNKNSPATIVSPLPCDDSHKDLDPGSLHPVFWGSAKKNLAGMVIALARFLAWLTTLGSRHGSLPTQLAERLALTLGLPLLTNLVQYRRPTRKQGQLRLAERRRNVRLAMSLRRFARPARVAGQRILLVDDVLTTGATLAELARVLRLAGASQIHVAVLARAAADR